MYITYENFKSLVSSKSLLIQYTEFSDHYDLFAHELGILYNTTIYKANSGVDGINTTTEATRISDFETRYKPTANAPLEIKAGAGRPIRVSASPQPINTIQKYKGFQLVIPANATTANLSIAFPSDIYLRGGSLVNGTTFASDDTISLDVLYTVYGMVVVPNVIEHVYLAQSIDQRLDFVSAESMSLAKEFSLRVTVSSPSGSTVNTARILNLIVSYFI